jgi:hypothetical protein
MNSSHILVVRVYISNTHCVYKFPIYTASPPPTSLSPSAKYQLPTSNTSPPPSPHANLLHISQINSTPPVKTSPNNIPSNSHGKLLQPIYSPSEQPNPKPPHSFPLRRKIHNKLKLLVSMTEKPHPIDKHYIHAPTHSLAPKSSCKMYLNAVFEV